MPDSRSWDARILATDIDTEMVAQAAAGIYPADRVAAVPEALRRASCSAVDGGPRGHGAGAARR